MKLINGLPPKGKDFLIKGSNGVMMVCRWYDHPNGKSYIVPVSESQVYWDQVKWLPLLVEPT